MKFVKLTGKTILLVSPEPWNHIFVSKHHYAVHLSRRGNKVYFLGPPGDKSSVEATIFENVFNVTYKGFSRGLRFFPAQVRRKIIARTYGELTALCKTDFDVVWSFDNSVFFDLSALPATALKISHIVDYNQDFQTKRAASTADFCFCTSDVILNRLSRYSAKVHKINHGYNVPERLADNVRGGLSAKTTALYAGNLSIPYIDWTLLSKCINNHPEVHFLFVGPVDEYSREMTRLAAQQNVTFVGRVSGEELAGYYHGVDVLLVAYKEQFQDDQTTNPHKMMEYLGSGKVIVATRTGEYEGLSPMIMMSEFNSSWPHILSEVIGNLEYYNSEEIRNQRISFAMNNTYDIQINRIERIFSR